MLIYLCIYPDNYIVCENKGCENHQNHPKFCEVGTEIYVPSDNLELSARHKKKIN